MQVYDLMQIKFLQTTFRSHKYQSNGNIPYQTLSVFSYIKLHADEMDPVNSIVLLQSIDAPYVGTIAKVLRHKTNNEFSCCLI